METILQCFTTGEVYRIRHIHKDQYFIEVFDPNGWPLETLSYLSELPSCVFQEYSDYSKFVGMGGIND